MVKPAREPRRRLPTVQETSSGGLVVDLSTGMPRVAVICRLNRAGRAEWCLPKGHVEGEETLEEAAVREIEEETGIRGEVVEDLGSIDYWFSADGRRIHKVVHLFLLKAVGGTLTVENDPDAEAIDVEWVPLGARAERLAIPTERRAAVAATLRLGELA
ncbi:NUDIX hydrolase [Kineococcus sp. SYSU DK003]|uniref:NUDIX hydrolase n=1 Tax=Kineococcus sp. SYSU DK003 TaxID=3383124 RepID=UPI003D7E7089